ncbi:MAG: hypothetical protein KGJ46_06925, partial [Xanthomonadaceae bacterium]|nr:hypothetical protein [Xanthomonadaceae bacterium]
ERDTLRTEYRREDLGQGVRGKYSKRFAGGTNLVLLSPDVARAFPDSESVNEALRGLLHIAERSAKPAPANQSRRG